MRLLTARHPMRLIAMVIILSLVSATVLYFYDILISGFSRLTWKGQPLVSPLHSEYASAFMSITIGLGILAESAPTILDKLTFWGQIIDNKIIKYYYHKPYFLDEASHLLLKTRLLFNRTNFHLQAIAIPTDNSVCNEKDLKKLSNKVKNIKNNCQKINTLLEMNRAQDPTHLKKQEHLKQLLNNLVSSNLEMSSWVESIASKMSVKHEILTSASSKLPQQIEEEVI
jgi:hypothetical protein